MSNVPDEHRRYNPAKVDRLDNVQRLESQVGKDLLAELLALQGDEDLADLGSGTGFYTNIVAGMTSGTVYAVEIEPEMIDHYRQKGIPANVRIIQEDIRLVSLPAESIDAAYSIVTAHETNGDFNFPSLLKALRAPGRLVIIDWRTNPEGWESGPPSHERIETSQLVDSLSRFFEDVQYGDTGRYLFWVLASGLKQTPESSAGTPAQ